MRVLHRLSIDNFLRIAHLDLRPKAPVVFVAGENEAGKSSLAEAIRFLFLDDSPRVKLKRDRGALVHNNAKNGSVTAAFAGGTVTRSVRDGKASGDAQILPTDTEVAAICLQATRFSTLPDPERRALVLRLAKVDLSVDTLAAKLLEKGISPDAVKKLRPLLKAGTKPAYEQAKRATSDARGAWREVTGETYGAVKAETWAPDQPVISTEESAKSLAALDLRITELRAARETDLSPVLANIKTLDEQLARPEPLACPHCGGAVVYEDGALTKFEGTDKKRLSTQLSLANLKRKQLTEQYDERIRAVDEDKAVLQEQIADSENAVYRKTRARELHEEAQTNEHLATLLGDGSEGIAAELIAVSLKPLNERLLEIGQAIGWTPVAIMGDMSIQRTDGHDYALLSESAQWRVDAMLHILVSELAGFQWLVFDRVDVLLKSRVEFVQWLDIYGQTRGDELTIVAMATLKAPLAMNLGGVESYWIQEGAIAA